MADRFNNSRRSILLGASAMVGLLVNKFSSAKPPKLTSNESPRQPVVSVAEFGAKGDGLTNDTAAFMAADAHAASIGTALHIPKPAVAYYGSGFRPTTDWICESGTLFLNSNRSAIGASGYSFFVVERDVKIFNAIVDANRVNTVTGTSDIPVGGWTAKNFNAFTGGAAIVVQKGAKPTFVDCEGRNGGGLPCWHMTNSTPKLYRCKANGGRGNFGDGFYLGDCVDAVLEDCESSDVTRINFVSDDKCAGTSLVRPKALKSHNAGFNYGGTEFNASIWLEHTVGSTVQSPDCDNIIRVGGAKKWVGNPRAKEPLNIIGGRSNGMTLSSIADDLFDVHVRDHKTGKIIYSMTGRDQTVTFDGVTINAGGGGSAPPLLNGAISCDGEIENTNLRISRCSIQVTGNIDAAAHGHIAFHTKLPHLTIASTKGYDSAGTDVPLTIGGLTPANVTTGALNCRDVDIALQGNYYAETMSFDGRYSVTCDQNVNIHAPVYFGPDGIIKTNVITNTNRLFIYRDITIHGKVRNVRIRMIGDPSKSIADFSGATFEADAAVMRPMVFTFLEPNWKEINFSGTVFRNTGSGNSANSYWIDAQTGPGIKLPWLVKNASISDSVGYVVKHGTTFENPGFRPAAK